MGRKKVEVKRIEDKNSRQVSFSKRRKGLMKKAREISVLCDVDVALLVFSTRGKLYHFSSGHNSLEDLIKRYRERHDEEGSRAECTEIVPYSEMVTIVQRCLGNIDELDVSDLEQLEKKLNAAVAQTRSRKTDVIMESIASLQDKEKLLEAERDQLLREVEAMEEENNINMAIDNNIDTKEMTSNNATLSLLHL